MERSISIPVTTTVAGPSARNSSAARKPSSRLRTGRPVSSSSSKALGVARSAFGSATSLKKRGSSTET
jgi:hypothetical protein